jgi:hypothetical protein
MNEVWGKFNEQMGSAFFVNLNEFGKASSFGAEDKIKQLITDERIVLNMKFKKPVSVRSYHHFLVTTNNPDPIKITEDDRRYVVIRSSDELRGNTEYFAQFHQIIRNPRAVRAIYEYFTTPCAHCNMDQFRSLPLPESTYSKQLKRVYKDPVLLWLEHLVSRFYTLPDEIEELRKQHEESLVGKRGRKKEFVCAKLATLVRAAGDFKRLLICSIISPLGR